MSDPTMRAHVVASFGDPDSFVEREIERPEPGPNEVLVEVAATSVNPVDYKLRAGGGPLAPEPPAVLHGDLAGTVAAVGLVVEEFETGDAVYGCVGGVAGASGTLAEYALADDASLAHKPESLSMREAAALPLVTITAWEGLHECAGIGSGDSVLVHGGTGGVGHVAVQLAAGAGATVTATASTERKRGLARDLGATNAADYAEPVAAYVERFSAGGFDTVFDTVGSEADNLGNSFAAARHEGDVVTTMSRGEQDLTEVHTKGLSVHTVFMLIPLLRDDAAGKRRHGGVLKRAAAMVESGKLAPLLDDERFAFDEPAAAHRRAASVEAVGKVTLARE
jgi:NADPH2:quinone reductase